MTVRATCPHCGTPCMVEDKFLGRIVRCFKCAQVFRLQTPKFAPPSEAPSTVDADDLLMPTFDVEPAPVRPKLTFDMGSATTVGRVRSRNEDAFLVRRQSWNRGNDLCEMAFLAIADGMGGYGGGEQASTLAVQAMQSSLAFWFDAVLSGQRPPQPTPTDVLRMAFNDASAAVYRAAQGNPQWKGMGAAAVVSLLDQDTAYIAHVGDCRAYHYHGGQLRQLTKDHTLVQRMLDLGTLKPHEAARHPARNDLSQALGRRWDVAPDFNRLTLSRGDWLLLACDGLQAHLSPEDLCKEIELLQNAAPQLALRLIEAVNQRGGTDNCTVIAVRGH